MTMQNNAAIIADPSTAVVERAPLTRAFEIVNQAVQTKNTIPILANARLMGDGSTLFVSATDQDLELTVAIPAAADPRFGLTLPAGKMRDLLKKATASDFVAFTMPEFETTPADGHIPEHSIFTGPATVDFERVKYRLESLHPCNYPDLRGPTRLDRDGKPDATYRTFKMTGAELWAAIDATMAAISTEETRYYLNGIYVHVSHDGGMRFVATDGHRLYRQDVTAPEGSEGMPGIIIPRKTVTLLHKLTKGKACPDHVEIEATDCYTRFIWSDGGFHITLTSKLIDGTFPDYQRVCPSFAYGEPNTARFDPAAMLEAIRAVSLICSKRSWAVKMTMDPASIRLNATDPDTGSAQANVAAEFEGPADFEVGYNATYLSDALATASPDGSPITWKASDSGSPCVITGQRAGWMAVVMPMRV
jgi:DNA polymerase III subunit beta